MFFKCKSCLEKDKRISDLKEQIKYLQTFVIPNNQPVLTSYEADSVLSASQTVIEIPDPSKEELDNLAEIQSEATRLIIGNY